MIDGDQPRAFELARRVLVARAPQEVLVVEAVVRIVPAAVAGVVVDHAVGRVELVGRMGEAADHHHRRAHRPGEPGQPARQADEELGVLEPARALLQRAVAGLVLGAVRDVVPDKPGAVRRLLVDADDAVAGLLQERDDLAPAVRVVPVLCLRRALHRDADIGLGDRPAVVGERNARRHLGRIDAQDVAGGAVQPDIAEVAGLEDEVLVVEEQARCCRSRSSAPA